MEGEMEKALLTSAIHLTVKWTSSPIRTTPCSGQLASLHSQEYNLDLTEKSLPCGNDISIWKKLLQLPGKMHRKDLRGSSFPLGIQAPIERQTTMKSNSGVQYKWFSFFSFLSMPKTPPKPFLLLWQEVMQCASLTDVFESSWGVK